MKRVLLLTALTLGSAITAHAHVVSDRDLQVFRRLPPGCVTRGLRGAVPSAAGNVPPNRPDRWISVAPQRSAGLLLSDASARADTMLAESAWSAFDASFAQQLPDGSFRRGGPAPADSSAPMEDAAWLAAASRGLIAIMNGSLADRFRWRYILMKPKLQRAMDFLEAHSHRLLADEDDDAGALMVVAAAFLLADGTFHEERYGQAGELALARALALQRSDGLLPAGGKAVWPRHILGLEALQSIVIYFPSPTLERSAAAAARWGRALETKRARRPGPSPPAGRWDAMPRGESDFVLCWADIPLPPPLGTPEHE